VLDRDVRRECRQFFVRRRIPAIVNRLARDFFEASFGVDRSAAAFAGRGMFVIDGSQCHKSP